MTRTPPVRHRHGLGLSLLLAGLPGVWVLRYWLGAPHSQGFTVGLLAVGVLLVVRMAPFDRIRMYGEPVAVLFLTASILGLLTFATLAAPLEHAGSLSLSLVLAFSFAVFTVPRRDLGAIHRHLTLVALASCVLVLLPVLFGAVPLGGERLPAGATQSTNMVAFAGGVAVTMGVYSLWRARQSLPERLVAGLAVLSGLGVIVLSRTRSVVLGIILCAGVGLARATWVSVRRMAGRRRKGVVRRSHSGGSWLVLMSIVAVVVFAVATNRPFQRYAADFADYMEGGFRTLVLGEETGETSAGERRRDIEAVFERSNLTGRGYKSLRVDAPAVQAFHDMGIAGGLWFALVTVFVPLFLVARVVLKAEPSHPELCGAYLYVVFLPNLFFHGTPYDFAEWLPVVALYGLTARNLRSGRSKGTGVTVAARHRRSGGIDGASATVQG